MQLAVRATIVGPNPVAYVENGTVMDIVRVGDTLGEQRIVRIDLRGITFGDGSQYGVKLNYSCCYPDAKPICELSHARSAANRERARHPRRRKSDVRPNRSDTVSISLSVCAAALKDEHR